MSQTATTPVARAAERLRNFMLVTAARPRDDRADAIEMFAKSAGLSARQLRELQAQFEKATKDETNVQWAVIGVIIGLFLADENG